VTALIRIIKAMKPDKVTLRRSRTLFAVTGPNFELVTAQIDATYPDYKCVVPAPSSNIAICSRSELIGALARLSAVANAELSLVALTWTEGGPLHLFLPRQPGDADDVIAAEVQGAGQVALSLPQLAAMVDNFSCDRIHLEANNADTPLVLRGEQNKFGVLFSCRWNFETRESQ
jgi:DNA polymerase-3 subunit beta